MLFASVKENYKMGAGALALWNVTAARRACEGFKAVSRARRSSESRFLGHQNRGYTAAKKHCHGKLDRGKRGGISVLNGDAKKQDIDGITAMQNDNEACRRGGGYGSQHYCCDTEDVKNNATRHPVIP